MEKEENNDDEKNILKCSKCGTIIEENQRFCPHCGKKIRKKKRRKYPIKNNKKAIIILLILIILIITVCCIENRVKYNNDLKKCYLAIQQDYDYNKYESIINEHVDDGNFKKEAEQQLYKAIDEKIDLIKNGNNEPVSSLSKLLKDRRFKDDKMNQKYLVMSVYTRINTAKQDIEEKDYYIAYQLLIDAKHIVENLKDTEIIIDGNTEEYIDNTLNEIADKTVKQVIGISEEYLDKNDFDEVERIFRDFENLKETSKDFNDFYNNATEKINEVKRKEEESEKAKKKKRGVTIGMTKQEVLDSIWGEPEDINTSTGIWGVHEQWGYGNGNYLYFENGRLTAIQN